MAKSFFEKLASSLKMEGEEEQAAGEYNDRPAVAEPEEEETPMSMPDTDSEPESEPSTEPETVPYPKESDDGDEETTGEDGDEEGQEGEEETDPEGSYTAAPETSRKYETQLAAARAKTATRHRVTQKHITLPHIKELEENSATDEGMDGQLAIDVYQTEDDIIVKSTIAGVEPEDLDINIAGDTVTIHGARKKDEEISNENYYYQECYWGSFSRSIVLPVEVDGDRAEASFQNGILTIRLPKIAKNKLKKIRVMKK